MADYGANYTDQELVKLEKRIKKVYGEAAKDIESKMNSFTAKSKAKEQKYLQQVKDGKMTQAEFDRWKAGQVFQGKQWQAKKEEIAAVLYNANTVASNMANNTRLNVFATNANFASYQMEHDAGVNFGFALYDQDTVARLIKDEPNLLPNYKPKKSKDMTWNRKKITSQITQSIIQGESLNKISKRLATVTASQNMNSMKTHARTLMTSAQNAGRLNSYKNAQNIGIDVEKEWMATLDNHTRDSHASLDGEIVPIDKPFSNGLMYPGDPDGAPAEVYNCFIPETNIASDSEIIRSYKHWYSGKVVSVKSTGGVNFTCTPNHPILTDRGWIAAKFLNKGDHLIVTSGINNEISRRNPNINHAFPRIDAIHELFYITGGKRTSNVRVNFHGDIPTTEVEIITQKRFLGTNLYTGIGKSVDKFLLKYTNTSFAGKSSFMKHLRRIVGSSFSNIGSISKPFSFINRSLSHSNVHRFGSISDVNVGLIKYSINDLSTDSNFFGESLTGLTDKIFLDDIISVDVSDFTGHVYNLQTKNNYYFVNNNTNNTKSYNDIFAIAHNCRCSMVSEIKKYPSSYNRYDNIDGKRIDNMSYREWVKAKGIEKKKKPATSKPVSTVINGKDISATWQRRSDQFDFEIEDVINAQGFDGKPRVVSAKEFDKYVQEANDGKGFIAQRTYSAPNQETLNAYRDQLYNGKWYVDCSTGGAQYGQGMYCAADYDGKLTDGIKEEMEHYKKLGESRYPAGYKRTDEVASLRNDSAEKAFNKEFEKSISKLTKQEQDVMYRWLGTDDDDIRRSARAYLKTIGDEGEDRLYKLFNDIRDDADKVKHDILNTDLKEWARSQGIDFGASSYTETLTLDKSAKIIKYKDINGLRKEQEEKIKLMLKEKNKNLDEILDSDERAKNKKWRDAKLSELRDMDDGSFAAMMGYDAINAEGHGESGSYTVILNRTKIIIKGE